MAVDTAQKRYSIGHLVCPWRRSVPIPDGTIGADDRAELMLLYSGMSLSAGVTGFGRLEFTMPAERLEFTIPDERLEFTLEDERLEFTSLEP